MTRDNAAGGMGLAKIFSLAPTIIVRCEPQYYGTYAAFDYRTVRAELLSEDEYRILEYVYANPSEATKISGDLAIEHDKCERFLDRMTKLRYVQVNADLPAVNTYRRKIVDPELQKQFPLPFLSAPSSVDVFITSRCNLHCVHCFSSIDDGRTIDLSLEEVESLLDQLEALRVLEIRINGGEPLLHPHIDKILNILKQKRLRKVIVTNGTLLDEARIRLLSESDIIPTVSIDGSNAQEHDFFRGSDGSFQRTVASLKLLQKHRFQYGINCCLHRGNLKSHRQIIELAIRNGASRIAFLDLKTSLRMSRSSISVPSQTEYERILPELMLDRVRYARKIDVALDTFLTCKPLEEAFRELKRGYISCYAGRSRLSIDSNGSVYPCNLVLTEPKWSMGSIRTEQLSDIWHSRKWWFFRGGVKTSDLLKCKDCKRLAKCEDVYCRVVPYLTSGDPLAPHPKCSQNDLASETAQQRHQESKSSFSFPVDEQSDRK